ncbi:MAG: hypothetical protein FJ398_11420 [Verrucomicrobia bacterium]|nr:hypothetical protein [Verrucomicrobiota bacterium]
MSRLQQKCLVASAGTHLALLSLLFISPAFIPSKQEPELPVVYFLPDKLTDDLSYGGGSPTAVAPPASAQQTPPPAPPVQAPQAQVIPPREPDPTPPEPKPAKKPEPERTPPKPKPDLTQTPATKPLEKPATKPAKPKHEIKPTFDKSADSARALAEAKARAKAEADQKAVQARLLEKWNQVGRSLKNLSSGTSVEIPGPGGEFFFANYRQYVKSVFENAWLPPDDVNDDSVVVKTEVVILRDGTIRSARIIRRSGIPALDQSVERALSLKDPLRPFPEGTKDTERTFYINFNLKAKRSTG